VVRYGVARLSGYFPRLRPGESLDDDQEVEVGIVIDNDTVRSGR
jgi:hypothetical protein